MTEPGFGVIVNWILLRALASLILKFNILMNGVSPARWPVIVMDIVPA